MSGKTERRRDGEGGAGRCRGIMISNRRQEEAEHDGTKEGRTNPESLSE